VGGVGRESLLGLIRALKLVKHVIEGIRQSREFVVWALKVHAMVPVTRCRDGCSALADLFKGLQHAAGQ
jgi:hypothetical protein